MSRLSEETKSSMPFLACKERPSNRKWAKYGDETDWDEGETYIQLVDVNMLRSDAEWRRYAVPEPQEVTDVQPPHSHSQVLKQRKQIKYRLELWILLFLPF